MKPSDYRLSIRLPLSFKEELREVSKQKGDSMSKVVQNALREVLFKNARL